VQAGRLKTLDALTAFFKEKSALDRHYSRALKKLAKLHLMENETRGSPLQSFLHGVRDLIETLATNYDILAAKEADQMLVPLSRAKAKLQADNKTLRRESDKFGNHLRKLQTIHKQTRHEARMLCRESIQARKKHEAHVRGEKDRALKIEQKRKRLQAKGLENPKVATQYQMFTRKLQMLRMQNHTLAERSKKMKKEFSAADHKYIAAVKACREFRAKHDSAASTVLLGLEKTERARVQAIKEGLRRYLKVETEMCKKLLVSFQSVAAIAESVDVNDEIKAYAVAYKTGKKPGPLPEYYHFPSFESAVFKVKFDSNDYVRSPKKPAPVAPNQMGDGKIFGEVKALIDATLESGKVDAEQEKKFNRILESKDGREAFAAALNFHRNHGFDKRFANGMELKKNVFDILAGLMLNFLDHANQAMDTAPTQLVMIISQTFFYIDENHGSDEEKSGNSKKIFLQSRVRDHPLWKSNRFWEEAFFASLSKALTRDSRVSNARWLTDREQAEALDRQKKVLFGQLGAYAHNMLGFGMPVEPTLKFVQKICDINELGQGECEMLLGVVRTAASTQKSSEAQSRNSLGKDTNITQGSEPEFKEKEIAVVDKTEVPKNPGQLHGPSSLQIPVEKDEVISICTGSDSSRETQEWTAVTHSDLESSVDTHAAATEEIDELP